MSVTRLPNTTLDLPTEPLGATDLRILARPPTEYFSPSGTACTVSSLLKNPAHFLTIQVTILREATCIGITVPHFVLDAHGAGLVITALDAEVTFSFEIRNKLRTHYLRTFQLNGRDWKAPAILTSNPVVEVHKRHVSGGRAPIGPGTLMDRIPQTTVRELCGQSPRLCRAWPLVQSCGHSDRY